MTIELLFIGTAGALARNEREARAVQAATDLACPQCIAGEGARGPSKNGLLPLRNSSDNALADESETAQRVVH